MNTIEKIPGTDEAWESRALGSDPNYASLAVGVDNAGIDAALELQPISIRLQKSLIDDFKLIAQLNGMGYQPLMRQVLTRFADCEKKRILRETVADMARRQQEPHSLDTSPSEPKAA